METAYEFDRVVFLSTYLTPHTETFGDIERLRSVFRACGERKVQFLFVTGPAGVENVATRERTGKGIIASAADDLCRHYATHGKTEVKVLHTPYLYTASATLEDPFLLPLFDHCSHGSVAFEGDSASPLPVLCAEELAPLIQRIFDSWDPAFEVIGVADCFDHTVGDLGRELQGLFDGLKVIYGDGAGFPPVADAGPVRRRYGWFQRYDLLRDLSTIKARWERDRAGGKHLLQRVLGRLQVHTLPLKCLETLCAWVLFEGLVHIFAHSSQLNVLDYRLLYVVLIGTLYGLDFGLIAALLACVGLAFDYFTLYGYTFQGLFYEPSNWLPFIAYFVIGSVCGYVQLRHREALSVELGENALLRNRNEFLTQLYHDASEDKRELRHQIVGRHDSFGKIFAVTQELDLLNPRDIYRTCCEVLQDILENDSISIYHVSGGAFARLVAASPAVAGDAARSLALDDVRPVLDGMEGSPLWVNRSLEPKLPMYAYAVRRSGKTAVFIFVRSASESQMTLYYQNLFRIICGLVESALRRAFEYEDVAQDKRYIAGTRVLTQDAFAEELAAAQALVDRKMGSYLLLRVVPGLEPVPELVGSIGGAIRESDAAGLVDGDMLYLLMRQAGEDDLPVIRERFARKQIAVEPVEGEVAIALLQRIRSNGKGAVEGEDASGGADGAVGA